MALADRDTQHRQPQLKQPDLSSSARWFQNKKGNLELHYKTMGAIAKDE